DLRYLRRARHLLTRTARRTAERRPIWPPFCTTLFSSLACVWITPPFASDRGLLPLSVFPGRARQVIVVRRLSVIPELCRTCGPRHVDNDHIRVRLVLRVAEPDRRVVCEDEPERLINKCVHAEVSIPGGRR